MLNLISSTFVAIHFAFKWEELRRQSPGAGLRPWKGAFRLGPRGRRPNRLHVCLYLKKLKIFGSLKAGGGGSLQGTTDDRPQVDDEADRGGGPTLPGRNGLQAAVHSPRVLLLDHSRSSNECKQKSGI